MLVDILNLIIACPEFQINMKNQHEEGLKMLLDLVPFLVGNKSRNSYQVNQYLENQNDY